jgi:ketosteroid isomerase-like protein
MSTGANGDAEEALGLAEAFADAFDRHDIEAIGAMLSEDCVFESAGPAPLGLRHEGRAATTRVMGGFFTSMPELRMVVEETYGLGHRSVLLWKLTGVPGSPNGRRGVDLFTVENGHIVEILAYAKG